MSLSLSLYQVCLFVSMCVCVCVCVLSVCLFPLYDRGKLKLRKRMEAQSILGWEGMRGPWDERERGLRDERERTAVE